MPVQCKICQMIVENLKKMYFTELIIDYIELMQFCPIFSNVYTFDSPVCPNELFFWILLKLKVVEEYFFYGS